MRPLFRAAGHEFFSPTYTGLGERAHLARPRCRPLDPHPGRGQRAGVRGPEDVTLLGHSYGGMVATGVADKAADRIARVVYIDAFAPKDGQSLFDLVGPKAEAHMRAGADKDGDGWKLPLNPMPPDTAPEDLAWAVPRRRPQPIKTFEQKIKLTRTTSPAAPLHLREEERPGRRLPPVRRPRQERARLEVLRDRRQPQPAHHLPRCADEALVGDHGGRMNNKIEILAELEALYGVAGRSGDGQRGRLADAALSRLHRGGAVRYAGDVGAGGARLLAARRQAGLRAHPRRQDADAA